MLAVLPDMLRFTTDLRMVLYGVALIVAMLIPAASAVGSIAARSRAGAGPSRRRPPMTALLQVRGLTKRYFGLTAVDDVSYEVEAGAIVGLIGPNGSGKSTSIDCISGFQPANGGQWSLDGVDLTGLPPHRIARAGLTRSFQTVRAYDELTLLENSAVAAQETDGVGWLPALCARKVRAAEARPKRAPTTCWPPSALPTTPPRRPRSCPTASASCSPSPPA